MSFRWLEKVTGLIQYLNKCSPLASTESNLGGGPGGLNKALQLTHVSESPRAESLVQAAGPTDAPPPGAAAQS